MCSLCRNLTPPRRAQVIAKTVKSPVGAFQKPRCSDGSIQVLCVYGKAPIRSSVQKKNTQNQTTTTTNTQESAGFPERRLGMENKKRPISLLAGSFKQRKTPSLKPWIHVNCLFPGMGEILRRWSAEELICCWAELLALGCRRGEEEAWGENFDPQFSQLPPETWTGDQTGTAVQALGSVQGYRNPILQ